MIIICSGPDTYRAREKARELVAAFRKKHDLQGFSTESIDGTSGLSPVLSRLGGASLFTNKKLIRCDGLMNTIKIAEVRTLSAKLGSDKDQTILITVEEESPNDKVLKALESAPLFHYSFPKLVGSEFRKWVSEKARALGVSQSIAEKISELTDGDSWYAVSELEKQSACSHDVTGAVQVDENIFFVAEKILTHGNGWRKYLADTKDESLISISLSQSRSAIRVRDGQLEGLHPYQAKKLSQLRNFNGEKTFLTLLRAHVASRASLSSGKETETLI
jgi:hypothetical protein